MHDIVVHVSNDTSHTAAASPLIQYKDLYPDPPPSYEEYCSETADDGQGQTSQEPILMQPRSHQVQVLGNYILTQLHFVTTNLDHYKFDCAC